LFTWPQCRSDRFESPWHTLGHKVVHIALLDGASWWPSTLTTKAKTHKCGYHRIKIARDALNYLHLPIELITLVREGRLHTEVAAAYAALDALNARLDAWEASNPRAAALTPWHQGREAWKAAGRPRPPWYEALRWHGEQRYRVPLNKKSIAQDLLG
jgi:hypothetical protein